jgi:hypothetical protein
MYSILKRFDLETRLTCLIIFTIGCQQFPIIRIGGSFKLYELFAICLLFLNLFSVSKDRLRFSKISFFVFGVFIISPAISYIHSLIFLPYPEGFYRTYSKTASSFKFNYSIFPALQLLYMFFNYRVFESITKSVKLYFSFERIVRACIWIGTIIAFYSFFAMFFVDIIAKLPEYLQNKTPYHFRSSGLSQEPSFYVLYQTWIVLFIFYSKKLFSKSLWTILMIINGISLLLTISTTLVALILILVGSFFVLKNSFKIKIGLFILLCFLATLIYLVIMSTSSGPLIEALFINKLTNFFSAPEHTLDSGSFRSYTARIGVAIFKQYPVFGVGVGNSVYYMHLYGDKMGIVIFGETLFAGSFPQNTFSMVLSEQGILGGTFLFLLLFQLIKEFWKYRNYDTYCRMFFIGFLFNVASMITIAPIYSMFLWVFPALGIGYIRNVIKVTDYNKNI